MQGVLGFNPCSPSRILHGAHKLQVVFTLEIRFGDLLRLKVRG